jgi:hypothetical protein
MRTALSWDIPEERISHIEEWIKIRKIPQYVKKKSCDPEDDLNGRNVWFCKQMKRIDNVHQPTTALIKIYLTL